MIIEEEQLSMQVSSLLAAYPDLKMTENSSDCIRFQGSIFVNRIHNDFTVRRRFDLEIVVPLNDHELPYVIDVNNQIEYGYHHRYTNGRLCLATDTDLRYRFLEGFEIVAWMEEYVETYLFSYEYYQRFKEFPFGERRHGYIGVIESYQDMLKTSDGSETLRMMVAIASRPYRGHLLCPCNSGRKIRNCHGEAMRWFSSDSRRILILQEDLKQCFLEMEEYIKREKNQAKTK